MKILGIGSEIKLYGEIFKVAAIGKNGVTLEDETKLPKVVFEILLATKRIKV